jgi:polysaccharide pyruvyl transferase WcaK-like protein
MEATAEGPVGWGAPGRCAKAKEIPAASATATAVAAAKRRRLFMWGRILGGSKKADLFMRIGALLRGCKGIVLRDASGSSR